MVRMIQKIVQKARLEGNESPRLDRRFWLSRSAADRIAAVEFLRRQMYGDSGRLQRTARVVQRAPKEADIAVHTKSVYIMGCMIGRK